MPAMTFPLFDYRGTCPNPQYAEHFKMYEHVRDSEVCEADRAALRELWGKFESLGLADPAFVDRFPTEFGSRVWEMRLACTFAAWDWKLVPPKKRGHGPDLGVRMNDGAVMWFEATAPGNTRGADAIEATPGVVLHGKEIDRKVTLRFLNSITVKREQHARWRQKEIVGERDGFVIAISGSMVPEGYVETDELPRIVRIAFGLGEPTYVVPIGDDREDPHEGPRLPALTVSKTTLTGEERFKAALFLDDEAPEVSALLFSPAYFKERPEARGQEPGRDFVLVHNPFASFNFPMNSMRSGREFFMRVGVYEHRAGIEPV